MARERARRRRDRAFHIAKDKLTRVDPQYRADLYARAWLFIANLRARRILGQTGEDPADPEADEA